MNGPKQAIRAKVIELAAGLGNDATGIADDELIPERGGLDSQRGFPGHGANSVRPSGGLTGCICVRCSTAP